LGKFLRPWEGGNPDETVEFKFDNAELSSLIDYVAARYGLTFIVDDIIKPIPRGAKSTIGAKISFKTNKPLSKEDAWALFLTFLDMSGLTVVPGHTEKVYKIKSIDPKSPQSATKSPIPIMIGVNPKMIPDNDTYMRYVYFVKDASLDVIKNVIDKMRSATTPNIIVFPEVRAIVMTDKAYNIKAMLRIVEELDQVSMPETMSIMKLDHTDANKIAKLYSELARAESRDQQSLSDRMLGKRKPQTLTHFSPGARVIAYPRTNVLIILGTEEAVYKIKKFVRRVDKKSDIPYQTSYIYKLKYIEAEPTAEILSRVVQFKSGSAAAKAGGVRDGDKYFKSVSIVPEKTSNQLVITADYEDYLQIYDVIQKIDIEQPQITFDVMIMNVEITDTKEFGAQIRSKKGGIFNSNINFQTSGLGGASSIVENKSTSITGAKRLLGNLVSLASGATIGSNFLTIGKDALGIWGIFRLINTYTHTSIIATDYLTTTNNFPASLTFGETRRVVTGRTVGAAGSEDSFGDIEANQILKITPRISYEGLITLDIVIEDNQFSGGEASSGDRTEKKIQTAVIVADGDILALGGLIRNSFEDTEHKTPFFGSIPGFGWLFKHKSKKLIKSSILVVIRSRIVPTYDNRPIRKFTKSKIDDVRKTIRMGEVNYRNRDPIHRWLFKEEVDDGLNMIDSFVAEEGKYINPSQRRKRLKKKNKNKNNLSSFIAGAGRFDR